MIAVQAVALVVRPVHLTRFPDEKRSDILPLLESLNREQEDDKEIEISHLDREVLHGNRHGSVVLLIEMAYFYVNNSTKPTVFHAPNFYQLDGLFAKICTICRSPLTNI